MAEKPYILEIRYITVQYSKDVFIVFFLCQGVGSASLVKNVY